MPNPFAFLVLLSSLFPIIVAVAFLRPSAAISVIYIGTWMFLPEKTEIGMAGLPNFNKYTLTSLYTLGAMLAVRPRLPFRAGFSWPEAMLVAFLVSESITMLTNMDDFTVAALSVGAHTPYHVVKNSIAQFFQFGVPLLLARACFRSRESMEDLLRALVVGSAIYSLFFLWEVRMSPQLHKNIYGFMQHDFRQTVRAGGYRPMVFMSHGLVLAMFNTMALLSALILLKSGATWGKRRTFRGPAIWIGLLLVIGRSVGAAAFAALGSTLIALAAPRMQVRVAVAVTAFVMLYPALRLVKAIPTEDIVADIEEVNPERAASLGFRFTNEDLLMERALERPWFGWGGFNRQSIRDPKSGDTVSVVDGQWIIQLGKGGFAGLFTFLGIFVAPLVFVFRSLPRVTDPADRRLLAGVSVMVALGLADLVPNSLGGSLLVILAGAMYSLCEVLPNPEKQTEDRATARIADILGRIQAARDAARERRRGSQAA